MFGRAGRASLRAVVWAVILQTVAFGIFGWRIDHVLTTKLAVAAVPQNLRVSHTKAITVTRLVGNEAMVLDLNPDAAFEILSIRIHLTEDAPKEDLVASVLSDVGAEYCTCLMEEDLHNLSDYVWQPNRPMMLCQKSALHLEWPNSDGIMYGIEVYWRSV